MRHQFTLRDSDIENIPAPVLRMLLRASKRSSKKIGEMDDEDDEDDSEEENDPEEEREKLANLAEEQKGSAPKVEVTKDDLSEKDRKKLKRS